MPNGEDLRKTLARIDARGYRAYKDLEGTYDFGEFWLFVDHVQGDPFASPSRVRIQVSQKRAGFPAWLFQNRIRAIALQDYLTLRFAEAIRLIASGSRGIGGSGKFSVDIPGQEVLERTSCGIDRDRAEIRFTMGLPAAGRTILSQQAEEMFFGEIPKMVERSLIYENLPSARINSDMEVVEDQEYIRAQLEAKRWVAFIANGSLLPRRSGIDERPPEKKEIGPNPTLVPFKAPAEMESGVELKPCTAER